MYIVLGMLYESYVHPITILSTLPSAGVGALLALLVTGVELNAMALISLFLLIGIVKKNAIMMVDVAIQTQRESRLSAQQAIFEAALLRLRPILMTTLHCHWRSPAAMAQTCDTLWESPSSADSCSVSS